MSCVAPHSEHFASAPVSLSRKAVNNQANLRSTNLLPFAFILDSLSNGFTYLERPPKMHEHSDVHIWLPEVYPCGAGFICGRSPENAVCNKVYLWLLREPTPYWPCLSSELYLLESDMPTNIIGLDMKAPPVAQNPTLKPGPAKFEFTDAATTWRERKSSNPASKVCLSGLLFSFNAELC